ncbi:hypothetical protein HAV15_005375 [Penicillium sp. str. |nr:hypothetical protein HAV15_005375 [Penicillium sp. str. \
MVLVHIVLFKFRANVGNKVRQEFLSQIKTLKSLSFEKSKGFQYALVSYHEDRAALAEYQASSEHERVTSTYFIPYKEDLVRFDFETDQADETLLGF